MTCVNCQSEVEHKYCPNCGERASVERITMQTMLNNTFSFITNMDRGILYNFKNLTLTPQATILSYINGKRKNIFHPIAYLLVAVTLYILMENYFMEVTPRKIAANITENSIFYQMGGKFGGFVQDYLKYCWLFNVLLLSLFTRLFFMRYNYFEHIAINAFIVGHSTFIGLLFYPIIDSSVTLNPIIWLSILVLLFFNFKRQKNNSEIALLSILSLFFCFVCYICIPFIMVFFYS